LPNQSKYWVKKKALIEGSIHIKLGKSSRNGNLEPNWSKPKAKLDLHADDHSLRLGRSLALRQAAAEAFSGTLAALIICSSGQFAGHFKKRLQKREGQYPEIDARKT